MEIDNKLKETHLLPMVQIDGKEFMIDITERGFRKAEDPADLISFYTEVGRKMVRQCAGKDWRKFSLYPVPVKEPQTLVDLLNWKRKKYIGNDQGDKYGNT